MYFVFADDVRQRPTRPAMGPLIGAGAILVDAFKLADLEKSLHQLCEQYGFPVTTPAKAEFKWSPGRELWMRRNLVTFKREEFFRSVIDILRLAKVEAVVVLEDEDCQFADRTSGSHAVDVIRLLFERINTILRGKSEMAVVINDRPGGDTTDEISFLSTALEMLREGTRFVKFDRIALNVLCTQSRFVRLLQVADLITSCVAAYVSGEEKYSPPIFEALLPLLAKWSGRIGGFGLKIHPDYKYANLYFWLLSDTHFWKANTGVPLPLQSRLYATIPPHCVARKIWTSLVAQARARRPLMLSWLELARPFRLEGNNMIVQFWPDQELAMQSLLRPANLRFINMVLKEVSTQQIEVSFRLMT